MRSTWKGKKGGVGGGKTGDGRGGGRDRRRQRMSNFYATELLGVRKKTAHDRFLLQHESRNPN
jgi:hypothetical protein